MRAISVLGIFLYRNVICFIGFVLRWEVEDVYLIYFYIKILMKV